MTRMIDALTRRPPFQRIALAFLFLTVGLFLVGMAVGVIVAMVEQEALPRRAWVAAIPFVAAPMGGYAIFAAWRLAVPPGQASGFEKRYWRMWVLIGALGLPLGMALAISSREQGLAAFNPFSVAPLSPTVAIIVAALAVISISVALVLYHRTIDDHEEHAYLWGSQIGYYVLVVGIVGWWLLQRGGIVPPIDTAVAFAAILLSILVQVAVWAWFKFR